MGHVDPSPRCWTAAGVALPTIESVGLCRLLAGRRSVRCKQGWAAASKLIAYHYFKSPV